MPFQVSPGVNVTEIDLTTVIPAVSSTVGAAVGQFRWGPVEEVRLVTSEDELVDLFYEPNSNNYIDFFAAANFLQYSNALRVVRVVDTDKAKNASEFTDGGGAVLIKNTEHWDADPQTANTWYARYAGELGNHLEVQICDLAGNAMSHGIGDLSAQGNATGWYAFSANQYFTSAPGTSAWVSERGGLNDEIHIAVIDTSNTGVFAGAANGVLEVWPHLSKAYDAVGTSGDSLYFKDVINRQSQYIRVGDVTKIHADYGLTGTNKVFGNTARGHQEFALSGGTLGQNTSTGDIPVSYYTSGWDIFTDTDKYDVSLLITGVGCSVTGGAGVSGYTTTDAAKSTVINHVIDNVADKRKDAVAYLSPQKSDTVDLPTASEKLNAVIDCRNIVINKNTSYAFMDSGWKYQYDKYADTYRWMPLNPDMAGLCARTDNTRDPWWSPAGYTRGQVKNVVRLAFNPSKGQRDDLYRAGVNPVVTFPGQGTLLFGDKTLLTRPSAFDRINVRRLFIVLEKAISTAAQFSLFEFNDEFTRAQFRNMVEPFLRDVKGRRGVTDFKVICDETNNPGSVIDRNEFVGDIYIKPARSINFIQLNFVAVQTGVDFSEIVGKF